MCGNMDICVGNMVTSAGIWTQLEGNMNTCEKNMGLGSPIHFSLFPTLVSTHVSILPRFTI